MHSFRGKAGSKIANAAQCWGGSGGTLTHHQLHMGVHVSWRDVMRPILKIFPIFLGGMLQYQFGACF